MTNGPIDSEPGETYIPKRLDLPQAEIDRLNREKVELLAHLRSQVVQQALTEPASKNIDMDAVHEALDAEPPFRPSLTGRITADGRRLAGLMSKAKKLEAKAEADSERAKASREASDQARGELGSYMRQHGLK